MRCPKCGWNNPDYAAKCTNCFADLVPAQPQQPPQPPQQPYSQQQNAQQPVYAVPDYMTWAVIITIVSLLPCFCLPVPVAFGIVAIVKASQANNKKLFGDYLGALKESNSAKTWMYWAVGLDIVGVLWWIFWFLFIAAEVSTMRHSP